MGTSDAAKDKAMFDAILNDDQLQSDDENSAYPLTVLMEVVIGFMDRVKPWMRINRIFRSMPVGFGTETQSNGVTPRNFRHILENEMDKRKIHCEDIRAREVATLIRKGTFSEQSVDVDNIQIRVREYLSSGGREFFVSFESRDESVLIGFVRLRLPPILKHSGEWHPANFVLDDERYGDRAEYEKKNAVFPELYHSALVREVLVYGFKLTESDAQREPRGYAAALMTEAERIAEREGYARVAVMASAGTRKYFRAKFGYRNDGAFMVKDLSAGASGRAVEGMFASSNEDTEDLFEERIMARVGEDGAGAVQIQQKAALQKVLFWAFGVACAVLAASQMLTPLNAIVMASIYMAFLNYALFWSVPFGVAGRTNEVLLVLSRFTMALLDVAVIGKAGSTFLPFIDGECMCSSYWTASLVSYVTAIYAIKLLYYKRASLMMKDPMVCGASAKAKASNSTTPSCSVAIVMCSLIAVFLVCQFLVTNLSDSECTGKGVGECCRDTFAPLNTWFAIGAIAMDLVVLCRFLARWNAFLSMFAEETAQHMMNQFLIVSMVMMSCVFNALCHLSIVYTSLTEKDVNSFPGSPAFLFDVCIMATCLVLFFVDAQLTMATQCKAGFLKSAHTQLSIIAPKLRQFFFGAIKEVQEEA